MEDHLTREERKNFAMAVCKETDWKCPECRQGKMWDCPRGFVCVECGYSETLVKVG